MVAEVQRLAFILIVLPKNKKSCRPSARKVEKGSNFLCQIFPERIKPGSCYWDVTERVAARVSELGGKHGNPKVEQSLGRSTISCKFRLVGISAINTAWPGVHHLKPTSDRGRHQEVAHRRQPIILQPPLKVSSAATTQTPK